MNVTSIAPNDREPAIRRLVKHYADEANAPRYVRRQAAVRAINLFRRGVSASTAVKEAKSFIWQRIERPTGPKGAA